MKGGKKIKKAPKGGFLGAFPLGNIEKGGKYAWEFYGC